MNDKITMILVGALGSGLQEILHWYELKFKLHQKKYRILFTSGRYWLVVAATILAAGLVTWAWFDDSPAGTPPRHFLLFGFGMPLIFKKVAQAIRSTKPVHLGEEDSEKATPSFADLYLADTDKSR